MKTVTVCDQPPLKRSLSCRRKWWTLGAICVASAAAYASDGDDARIDFNRQIRPILSKNCYA